MMNNEDNLSQGIEFWSQVVRMMDNRVKQIAQTPGFGEVNLGLIIKYGKVIDIVLSEQVRVRQKGAEDELPHEGKADAS